MIYCFIFVDVGVQGYFGVVNKVVVVNFYDNMFIEFDIFLSWVLVVLFKEDCLVLLFYMLDYGEDFFDDQWQCFMYVFGEFLFWNIWVFMFVWMNVVYVWFNLGGFKVLVEKCEWWVGYWDVFLILLELVGIEWDDYVLNFGLIQFSWCEYFCKFYGFLLVMEWDFDELLQWEQGFVCKLFNVGLW